MPKYEVGANHRDFTFTKVVPIDELNMIFYELRHEPTGARVMHLEADDPENLFSLSFQTLPTDSTGVAHILEHTVLCGSKKYPVKDPFFSMTRRSLNTFMNAMTGSDFTCYPAASQVEEDFYNLMEVYLDAVFNPELKELSFLQEGHRLEFEKGDDPTTPLLFKGVVFNEMKGTLTSPETRLWQEVMTALTPDLPYAFNSGGDPKEIPNLTHEELKAFHQTYYHPSHCLFFFYGSFPLAPHLDFIAKHALKGIKKSADLPPISLQRRFEKPHTLVAYYPPQSDDNREFVTLSWLTTDLKNQEDALSLALLESILMETDASPLKLPLLKSGLCTQADGYLDLETSEIPYTIICRGCKNDSGKEIEALILNTLEEIAESGIDSHLIEAALHQLEFSRLEITGDYGPFGLTLFFRSALAAQHGCPAENALSVHSQFSKLLLQVKDPDFLPALIRRYFLNNSHRTLLSFKPDPTLQEKEEQEEREKLKKIKEALTEEERSKIVKQAADLKKFQEKMESQSLECLPKILLTDVPKNTPDFLITHEQQDQLTIFHHDCFTNHILSANLIFDLPHIAFDDLPYLQLLLSLLPELGAGERDYRENLEYINAYLGDFSASVSLYPQIEDPNLLKPTFSFRGKALSRNVDKLFALFKDICRSPQLDDSERMKELILQIHTSLENRLSRSAMSYAIQLSLCSFNQSAFIGEQWSGLSYLQFIRSIARDLDRKLPEIIERLKALKSTLYHFTTPHLVLSCDADQYHTLSKESFYGIGDLPTKPFEPWKSYSIPSPKRAQARPISSPVAFSAFSFKVPSMVDHSAPALSVSTDLLENTFLHKKIREQGGAYGSGAGYNSLTGSYTFHGYRDPHITSTYRAFEESIAAISKGSFSDRDLTEAKLGLIQDFDSPISPGSRAMVAYCYFRDGRNKVLRQDYRDHLLSTQKKDVKEALSEHLLKGVDEAIKVTFTSESLLKKENSNLPIIPF
ncbi:MAG: hypothetical protein K1060chlam2_00267 [Chlamydiae bacterium]|nr:hypothetical protein [Chlamydiota bacterium]